MSDGGQTANDPNASGGGASLEDGLAAAGETSALIAQIKDLQQQCGQALAGQKAAEDLLEEERVRHQDREADLSKQLLDMAEAKGKAERRAAKLTKLPRSAKARKCGPVKDQPDRNALFEKIGAGALVVVFSNGKHELTGFEPVRVQGADAWATVGSRVMLKEPILLKGLGPQEAEPMLRGFGLFEEDGDQIAWSALPDPIRVPAGGEIRIDRSIIF